MPTSQEFGQTIATSSARDESLSELHRLLFDRNPQPMWICDAASLKFLAVNESAVLKYGYSRQEFLSLTIEAVLSSDSRSGFAGSRRRSKPGQADLTSGVWSHCSKDGTVFEVELWSSPLLFQGSAAHLIVLHDITARRRAESFLSTRYALTRLLSEISGDVESKALRCLCESLAFEAAELWMLDADREYLCRQASWHKPGLEDVVSGPDVFRVPLEHGSLARVLAAADACLIPTIAAEPGYWERAETLERFGINAGLAFAVRSRGQVDGIVVLLSRSRSLVSPHVLALFEDIGLQVGQYLERRRIEQELRKAEETLRVFFDGAPVAYHEIDCDGLVVHVNQAEGERLGLDPSEIIGKPIWDFVAPDEREASRGNVARALRQRSAAPPFERKFRTKNGEESVFRVHARLIIGPTGEVTGLRTAMLDLTEEKRSRQQIDLQTSLLDQVQDAVVTVDRDFRLTYCNAAAERLFEWTAREAVGQEYKTFAGTQVTEAERAAIHAEILGLGSWTGEIICANRAGKQFLVHLSWSVVCGANGHLQRIIGIHRDLTAPKQMEQALRATEDRLTLAQSVLALGAWEVDLGSGVMYCSEQLLRMYGMPEDRKQLSVEEWHNLRHPDDREQRFAGNAEFFQGRQAFDQVFRIVWPDGSVHWLHSKSRAIFDERQRTGRVIGVDFDITDYMRTEERLRILSSAVEQSPVGIVISSLNGQIEYANAKLVQSSGYTWDELKGQNPRILMETPPEQLEKISQTIRTGAWWGIMRAKRKNGELFWVSVGIQLIRDSSGKPTHELAVAEDITERLEMETALKLSEERFRIAAESSGDSIYEWDFATGKVSVFSVNRKPSGHSSSLPPATHRQFLALLHPDDRERVRSALRQNIERGELYAQEYRVVLPNGEVRYYTDRGSTLRDATGKPEKWIGVCKDISEEKKVERANAEIAAIVECANAAIIRKDLDNRVLTWNRGAERVYGYSAGETIGRTMSEVIPPDRVDEDIAIKEKIRRGESVNHMETTRLTKSGALIHVLLTISPIRGRSGSVEGIAIVAWDITQIKELERRLAQNQKLESLGRMAAGIAHEINTPIQYIGDNAKFLEDAFQDLVRFAERGELAGGLPISNRAAVPEPAQAAIDEGLARYLQAEIPKATGELQEGVRQVARIVRAMKEFSHPGPAEKMRVDINRAIESAILVSRNEWKYVADLTTDFDRELPPVLCIAGEFNQVMLNLIVNAAHAISDVTKTSGGKGSIRIGTRQDGPSVEIRVSDTGGGIPEAIRSKVFDPFFTTKPVGKGTGQGLAIAHALIVQKHGGAIRFESEPGRGTTFIIQLPLECERDGL